MKFSTRSTLISTALFSAFLFTAFAASAGEAHGGKKDRSARAFERLDKNGDGKITRAESREMAETRFAKFDLNKDGAVTQEELKAGFEKRRAEHQKKRGDKARSDKKSGKKHHKKGAFFAKLDLNKDGKITRQEATQLADKRFARLDKNGDGSVTREEMKVAHQEMKKRRGHRKPSCKKAEGKSA